MFGVSAKVPHRFCSIAVVTLASLQMIGDAPLKMRQTNKKTLIYWYYNSKKSPKTNSNAAKKFLSNVWNQLLISNGRNKVH
jgi:hypothetical protein